MKTVKYIGVFLCLFFVTIIYLITNPIFFVPRTLNSVEISKIQMETDVNFLCGLHQARSNSNTTSLDSSADYIIAELTKSGYVPEEQKYMADGKEYRNVICSYGPKDGKRLIAGAHYDVCGEQQGADDNASGVAGLLEIARALKKQNPVLKYRIDMVFYTLEEPPHFRQSTMGSAVHAKYLHDNNIPVIGMVCLEMIGYFSEEKNSQHYPAGIMKLFYPAEANFITVVGKMGQAGFLRKIKRGMISVSAIDVRSINAPTFIPGIDFSDHLNYWQYDYDAIMITDTSFYRNENYHQLTDVPATLNFDKMMEVVKGVYNAVTGL